MPETITAHHLVVADGDGEVLLFHGPTLTAFPLTRYGELGRPVVLEPLADLSTESPVLQAAVSASGRRWLLRHFGGARPLRLFEGGEEVLLPPPPWRAAAIGFSGETPVVLVGPRYSGRNVGAVPEGRPPLLMRYDGSKWLRWVEPETALSREAIDQVPLHRRTDVLLVTADRGRLWLVPRYAYRLQQISSGGRPLTAVQRGDGDFEAREVGGEERDTRVAQLEAAAADGAAISSELIERFKARKTAVARQIDAAATGRDGMLYLLLPPSEESGPYPVLHRYNPVLATVEQAPVAVQPYGGLRTMAAGEAGLVIANAEAGSGCWIVPWEALRSAEWEEVAEVRIGSVAAE